MSADPSPDPSSPDGLRAGLLRDGYLVVRGFLDDLEVARIRDEAERYNRDIVPQLPNDFAFYEDPSDPRTLRQVNNMQLLDPFFEALYGHPKWALLARELLDEPVRCVGMQWFDKPPGTEHATPPHQDDASMNLVRPQAVAMWTALDPADADNGALRYVPGSHRRGLRDHVARPVMGFTRRIEDWTEADTAAEVVIDAQPGDLLVHLPLTLHRALPNRTSRRRRAFLQLFQGESATVDLDRMRAYEADLARTRAEQALPGYAFSRFESPGA